MLLYLASPIDQANGNSVVADWRAEAKQYIRSRGWSVYDPSTAFNCGELNPNVQRAHHSVMQHCDAVLALLPKGVPSIGTPMEVQYALDRQIPVIVVSSSVSWALAGTSALATGSVGEAFRMLDILHTTEPALQILPDSPKSKLPTRAYDGDAGLDLYASESVVIGAGEFRDVPVGFSMAIPEGYFARIVSRSSTFRNRRLDVREGIIDAGYRGSLYAGVHNMNATDVVVEEGERIAQMLIHEVPVVPMEIVETLPDSARGSRGFGSSGV